MILLCFFSKKRSLYDKFSEKIFPALKLGLLGLGHATKARPAFRRNYILRGHSSEFDRLTGGR